MIPDFVNISIVFYVKGEGQCVNFFLTSSSIGVKSGALWSPCCFWSVIHAADDTVIVEQQPVSLQYVRVIQPQN